MKSTSQTLDLFAQCEIANLLQLHQRHALFWHSLREFLPPVRYIPPLPALVQIFVKYNQ